MAERLTDALVRRASAGDRAQVFFWDDAVKGFGLRVTNRGAKSFVVDYRIGGRQRRITIGSYPDWTVAAARKEASDIKRRVDLGEDPMGQRHEERAAPLMRDLWARYRREHLPRKAKRSQADEASMWEKLILPVLGPYRLMDITHEQIVDLHRHITFERGTPVRANRVVEVIRKAFNLAIKWRWLEDNPASGVPKNSEEKRERYLTPEELSRLFAALNAHNEKTSADAIKLLALTGARKSEMLRATWDQFDLESGVWVKPSAHTKQRKQHRVPLSEVALVLLREIREASTGRYVFPGRTENQPLTDLKHTWASVCIMAGLAEQVQRRSRNGQLQFEEDGTSRLEWKVTVRIHDLRHSFASLLVSGGASLPVIGAMLGHTQVQTTQRYSHLYDGPLREAADTIGNAIKISGPRK